jgi:hypothetical protein
MDLVSIRGVAFARQAMQTSAASDGAVFVSVA